MSELKELFTRPEEILSALARRSIKRDAEKLVAELRTCANNPGGGKRRFLMDGNGSISVQNRDEQPILLLETSPFVVYGNPGDQPKTYEELMLHIPAQGKKPALLLRWTNDPRDPKSAIKISYERGGEVEMTPWSLISITNRIDRLRPVRSDIRRALQPPK